jgi:very-short-patch-repair endonuclease
MAENRTIKSPFKKGGMFNEADPLIFELAKQLRKNMTHAEIILWHYLKGGIKELRFRRQHPLSTYIVDFYCHNVKLVIEVDGSIHNDPVVIERDLQREADLRLWGYTIMRFTNERVIKEIDKVVAEITKCVEDLLNLKSSETKQDL